MERKKPKAKPYDGKEPYGGTKEKHTVSDKAKGNATKTDPKKKATIEKTLKTIKVFHKDKK